MHYTTIKGAMALLLTALLTACGGGGGGGGDDAAPVPAPVMVSGVFVDSPVEGLRWESKALTGTTDAAGTYQYEDSNPNDPNSGSDPVKFYIGDIYLGESTGYTVIIPVDIVSGANNIDNPTVLNIARTILTLDDDDNTANGVQITKVVSDLTVGETLNFAVSTDEFTTASETLIATLTSARTAGARALMSAADARAHLENTIRNLLAGSYSGTYSGDGTGNWSGTVTTDGQFTGTAVPSSGGAPIQLVGPVTTDGSGKAGFEASGGAIGDRVISFTGIFRTDGNAGGEWNDQDQADTGSWSGTKQ